MNDSPSHTVSIEPTQYWPCPPMLNMPARNGSASASAVRMIGVVVSSVCCRFCAETDAVSHQNQTCVVANGTRIEYDPKWKKKLSPVPFQNAW